MRLRVCDICGAEIGNEGMYRYRLWAVPIKVGDELTTLHPQDICEICMGSISRTLVRIRKERESKIGAYSTRLIIHREELQGNSTEGEDNGKTSEEV